MTDYRAFLVAAGVITVLAICLTAIVITYLVKTPRPLEAVSAPDLDDEDEEPDEPVQKALPVVPGNPPSWKVYQPKPGAPEKVCDCHQRTIQPGDRVLWFPQVDPPGSVMIFCAEGVEQ